MKGKISNVDAILTIPTEITTEFRVLGLTIQDIHFLKKCADMAGIKPPYNTNKMEVTPNGYKSNKVTIQEHTGPDSISAEVRTLFGTDVGTKS
jgi:hypothetical protein